MKVIAFMALIMSGSLLASIPTVQINLNEQSIQMVNSSNEIVFGPEKICSGRPGMDTPEGVYEVGSLEEDHWSNQYKCHMHWAEEIVGTSADGEHLEGVYMHEGNIYGYPSSHKCVRVANAEKLFRQVRALKKQGVVRIVISGSTKEFYKKRFGNLLTYDETGSPVGFARENGQLTEEFRKAYKERKLTLFCENQNDGLDFRPLDKEASRFDTSNWYFSLECWNDRRARGVSVAEAERFMGLQPYSIQIKVPAAEKLVSLYKKNTGNEYRTRPKQ